LIGHLLFSLLLCFLTSLRLLSLPTFAGKQVRITGVIARESGRSSIPPAPAIEPKRRGVLDVPLSRGMTTVLVLRAVRLPHRCQHAILVSIQQRGTKCHGF
jgi:hypothetical protein